MASAKAMARIDWTRIFVEAPGLRPTAVEAAMPINPTLIAAPSAANATCTLPVIWVVLSLCRVPQARIPTSIALLSVRGRMSGVLVLTNQEGEDGGQQHEDHRLHETDQQLHEVERHRQQPAPPRDERSHRLQHVLAGEHVAVETKAERHGPEQNRHDLQAPGGEEHKDHEHFQQPGGLALGCKQLLEDAHWSAFPKRPHDPTGKKHQRHGERHVEVGIGAAKERLLDHEITGGLMAPSDGAHARNEPDPVGGKNEDEDRREEPECSLDQVAAEDAFEQRVQTLHEPLDKVLRATRYLCHPSRGELSKDDQPETDDPRDEHGVRNRKAEGAGDLERLLRQAVPCRLRCLSFLSLAHDLDPRRCRGADHDKRDEHAGEKPGPQTSAFDHEHLVVVLPSTARAMRHGDSQPGDSAAPGGAARRAPRPVPAIPCDIPSGGPAAGSGISKRLRDAGGRMSARWAHYPKTRSLPECDPT